MSRLSISSFVLSGAMLLATGCTFEPPGSVLDQNSNTNTRGADAGGGGDEADAAAAGDLETMTITFTTTPAGGAYAPNNIVATWIEDGQGNFVQTIDRQAAVRVQHLVAWNQMAGADTDAVTGATRLNHNTPIEAIWEIPAVLPDGTYTIRIETCDDNSGTPDQNNQGSFTFEKNGTASTLTPQDANYLNVNIAYSGR